MKHDWRVYCTNRFLFSDFRFIFLYFFCGGLALLNGSHRVSR